MPTPARPAPRRPLARIRRGAPRALACAALLAAGAAACASGGAPPLQVSLIGRDAHVGRVPVRAFTNANGSPRITDPSFLEALYVRVAPRLEEWATDERLQVDPNYLTALFIKESGADTLALSAVPAIGLAQLTAPADADLRGMMRSPRLAWMKAEVDAWPRDSAVHAGQSRDSIAARLARGALGARTEYLFDPVLSARAAAFWVRLLQERWTTDTWPGGYGTFARNAIGQGRPLDDDRVFDLVTVSYNRGYVWTRGVVERYGRDWVKRLPELGPEGAEANDYLVRVRAYTQTLRAAPYR